MSIRVLLYLLFGSSVLMWTACSSSPTGEEIEDELERELESVSGGWTGLSTTVANSITFRFSLTEERSGDVSGNGTMQENNAPAAVPITVSGSFRRPSLALTFQGMVYEGRTVQGAFTGSYTSVGGIADSLRLSAPGYAKTLPVLLQED